MNNTVQCYILKEWMVYGCLILMREIVFLRLCSIGLTPFGLELTYQNIEELSSSISKVEILYKFKY